MLHGTPFVKYVPDEIILDRNNEKVGKVGNVDLPYCKSQNQKWVFKNTGYKQKTLPLSSGLW